MYYLFRGIEAQKCKGTNFVSTDTFIDFCLKQNLFPCMDLVRESELEPEEVTDFNNSTDCWVPLELVAYIDADEVSQLKAVDCRQLKTDGNLFLIYHKPAECHFLVLPKGKESKLWNDFIKSLQ